VKLLAWMLALALVAAGVSWWMQESHGSVVALAPPWRVDVSLNLFALLLAVALWLAYRAGRLAQQLRDFPERVRLYRERRSELSAQRGLREALRALFEGRFARAERAAQRAQSVTPIASLAALIGARAAHRMQEYGRREQWLERAEHDAGLATARLVLSAEMWSEQRDNAHALQAISQLHGAGARHIHALRIALVAHLQSGHWREAARIVRTLDKHRGLPASASEAYRVAASRGLLREARGEGTALLRAWREIPAADRVHADIALEAARLLADAGQVSEAGRALEEALAARWDERLVEEYGRCGPAFALERIERAEAWLRGRARDPALLLALGRLCLAQQLWGKARASLSESHRLRPSATAALALAELAEAVGEPEESARCFREAALTMQAGAQDSAHRAPERAYRREPTL
jgi:HemY protein